VLDIFCGYSTLGPLLLYQEALQLLIRLSRPVAALRNPRTGTLRPFSLLLVTWFSPLCVFSCVIDVMINNSLDWPTLETFEDMPGRF